MVKLTELPHDELIKQHEHLKDDYRELMESYLIMRVKYNKSKTLLHQINSISARFNNFINGELK